MTNILLVGACGKMGHAVAEFAGSNDKCQIIAGVDKFGTGDGKFPVYPDFDAVQEQADVIIDFSNPDALQDLLDYALAKKIPAVICTTGLNPEQLDAIGRAADEIPVFFSANMSLGVNLISELAQTAARILGTDYDIEIIEEHHNQKLDAPSGTALMLADAISQALPEQPAYMYDRSQKREKRSKKEIGIHAVRGGTIVGNHTILFAGLDETIRISHSAGSKKLFAVGAVNAALFLTTQKPGLYAMKDMIKA